MPGDIGTQVTQVQGCKKLAAGCYTTLLWLTDEFATLQSQVIPHHRWV